MTHYTPGELEEFARRRFEGFPVLRVVERTDDHFELFYAVALSNEDAIRLAVEVWGPVSLFCKPVWSISKI